MRDIALMGYARSGKDASGAHLVAAHGYQRVSFADPVRASLLALDPYVDAQIRPYQYGERAHGVRLSELVRDVGWERAKDLYPEVRALLQRHGTDAVRGVIGEDTWVILAADTIRDAHRAGKRVVVTDTRFPNEAAMLRVMGFRLVWVIRPGGGPANRHASENALSRLDADVTLWNAGDLADLRFRIEEVAR